LAQSNEVQAVANWLPGPGKADKPADRNPATVGPESDESAAAGAPTVQASITTWRDRLIRVRALILSAIVTVRC
jgi:hypothetical protein